MQMLYSNVLLNVKYPLTQAPNEERAFYLWG